MNNLFLDPAARTMVVAAMLKGVERKDRILPLAAAFAVNGELGIIPGAIAASRAAKEAREKAELTPLDPKDEWADDRNRINKLTEKLNREIAAHAAREAAKDVRLRQKAVEHLDQCADRFLAAIEILNPKEEQTADLITKIKEIEALLEKQKAEADAAAVAAAASGAGASSGASPTGAAPTGSASPSTPPVGQSATASTPTPAPPPPPSPAESTSTGGDKAGPGTRQTK